MDRLKQFATIGKCVLGAALFGVLGGCTTYVQAPPPPVYAPPPPGPGFVVTSDADFDAPLSPYGRWVVVGSYGRCWTPNGVGASWQPYSNGHWERTDAGWYWVSDESWGWATYHYGRWVGDPVYGWVWVPQTQWAPAWVSWREGGGCVGWAPLPPAAMIGVSGTIEFHGSIIAPRAFVFVQERNFLAPVRPATIVVNTTIINRTTTITKMKVVNKTVINEGPHTAVIERATGQKVPVVPVRQLRDKEESSAFHKQTKTGSGQSGTHKDANKPNSEKGESADNDKAAEKQAHHKKKKKKHKAKPAGQPGEQGKPGGQESPPTPGTAP